MNLYELPHVTNIKHTIEPTWSDDAGRQSNSGKFSGTFIGWFDTLEVSIGKTNQTQMTTIRNAIEHSIIENITFKDSRTGNNKTEDFYGTAIGADYANYKKTLYNPFSFKLVAIERRTDM